jgi:hypothetical protein
MSDEPTSNLVIYQTEDSRTRVECRLVDETIWLSQALMGELFDRSKKTISEHLRNLFDEGELDPDSVVRNFRTTASDGKSYAVAHYNLEAILAVGFRVNEDEVDTRNQLVVIFLEQAELRAKQQKDLTLDFWRSSVDRMLASNDQPLLDGPGSVSHEEMKSIATGRYEDFDAKRRNQEALAADAEDLKAIEDLEKDLKRKGEGK